MSDNSLPVGLMLPMPHGLNDTLPGGIWVCKAVARDQVDAMIKFLAARFVSPLKVMEHATLLLAEKLACQIVIKMM